MQVRVYILISIEPVSNFFTLVIIKGTQVYDSARGSFVDLSVLDVLQIFGRAGRPGMESSGVGYICTTQDKLDHYLDAVTSQVRDHLLEKWSSYSLSVPQNPIESRSIFLIFIRFLTDRMRRFVAGIIDALNAEIALGTVANVHDAVQWLGYTYLFVRMRKNPFQYGTFTILSWRAL